MTHESWLMTHESWLMNHDSWARMFANHVTRLIHGFSYTERFGTKQKTKQNTRYGTTRNKSRNFTVWYDTPSKQARHDAVRHGSLSLLLDVGWHGLSDYCWGRTRLDTEPSADDTVGHALTRMCVYLRHGLARTPKRLDTVCIPWEHGFARLTTVGLALGHGCTRFAVVIPGLGHGCTWFAGRGGFRFGFGFRIGLGSIGFGWDSIR